MTTLQALSNHRLLFDGSMGVLLSQYGALAPGKSPDALCLENPAIVRRVHEEYLSAGADVIATNTFGANPIKLAQFGLKDQCAQICAAAVALAKSAAPGAPIAASLGPTGQLLRPAGETSVADLIDCFKVSIQAFADAGADLLLVETMLDLAEARAALLAARAVAPQLPVVLSFTLENGRTLMGNPPKVLAYTAAGLGACTVGLNCGTGPEDMLEPAQALLDANALPVLVMPNAGLPVVKDGTTIFPQTPDDFAVHMAKLLALGVRHVGGCCGTTPRHIGLLRSTLSAAGDLCPFVSNAPAMLTSARQAFSLQEANAQAVDVDLGKLDGDDVLDEILCAPRTSPAIRLHCQNQAPGALENLLPDIFAMRGQPFIFVLRDDMQAKEVLPNYCGIAGVHGNIAMDILSQYGAIKV